MKLWFFKTSIVGNCILSVVLNKLSKAEVSDSNLTNDNAI